MTKTLNPLTLALAWFRLAAEPAGAAFLPTGSMNSPRVSIRPPRCRTGLVLVAGGSLSNSSGALSSAELYDSSTGVWTPTGTMNTARSGHTATFLATGLVLVAGGEGPGGAVAEAEIYDPAGGTWRATGPLHTPWDNHTAMRFANGLVLVAGGRCSHRRPGRRGTLRSGGGYLEGHWFIEDRAGGTHGERAGQRQNLGRGRRRKRRFGPRQRRAL